MNLVFIVNLCPCCLSQFLELCDLEFEKMDCILSGSLFLKGLGKVEGGQELVGEGFEEMDDVVWGVGSWLRPVVTFVCKQVAIPLLGLEEVEVDARRISWPEDSWFGRVDAVSGDRSNCRLKVI